ncbi:MAG: hypothetical protein ACRDOD_00075 [Streptosporangiaceae bacterium]
MPRFHHKRAIVASAVTSLAALAVASGGVAHAGSITQAGNSSVIATEAADHSLWFYFQPIGSAGWSSQQVAPPGTTFFNPSVAQSGNSTVIAAENPNLGLDFYWQPIGGSGWNHQQVAPAGTSFSAPSIARVGNSTVIATQGANGSLQFYWQPIGGSGWNHQQVAPPGPASVSRRSPRSGAPR